MTQHQFLLKPHTWLGQGKIQLNMVAEELGYYTRWNISGIDTDGRIECVQEVQVKGLSEVMQNSFLIHNLVSGEFSIDLENQALGRVTGKGIVNDKVIAWEFRVEAIGFEGFELYEKQDDKNYLMRAEYASAEPETKEPFRTIIQGRLWQQTS